MYKGFDVQVFVGGEELQTKIENTIKIVKEHLELEKPRAITVSCTVYFYKKWCIRWKKWNNIHRHNRLIFLKKRGAR